MKDTYAKPDEISKWIQIEALMMSDEEDICGKFKVRRQDWHSNEFNGFMLVLQFKTSSTDFPLLWETLKDSTTNKYS